MDYKNCKRTKDRTVAVGGRVGRVGRVGKVERGVACGACGGYGTDQPPVVPVLEEVTKVGNANRICVSFFGSRFPGYGVVGGRRFELFTNPVRRLFECNKCVIDCSWLRTGSNFSAARMLYWDLHSN